MDATMTKEDILALQNLHNRCARMCRAAMGLSKEGEESVPWDHDLYREYVDMLLKFGPKLIDLAARSLV